MSETQRNLDKLVAHLRAQQAKPEIAISNGHSTASGTAAPPYIGSAASATPGPTDEAIIEKCRDADNAAKFSDLFDHGDVHRHHGGDDSGADYALLGLLKFYTQDPDQLERLMRRSALARPKCD